MPTDRGWRLPEQTTSPPDVVKALSDMATDADADMTQTIQYGPEGGVPASLPEGSLYFGY